MLYLLHSDGSIEELAVAVRAQLDSNSNLVCYDIRGNVVAIYPRLEISMYSDRPFPKETDTAAKP